MRDPGRVLVAGAMAATVDNVRLISFMRCSDMSEADACSMGTPSAARPCNSRHSLKSRLKNFWMSRWKNFYARSLAACQNSGHAGLERSFRMGGRAVECTGLEIRQSRKRFVGSNPTPSAR
jgi:hypothetical protein